MTDTGRQALEPFCEYVAFIANSLIFLLIGAQEAQQHFSDLWLPVLAASILGRRGRQCIESYDRITDACVAVAGLIT